MNIKKLFSFKYSPPKLIKGFFKDFQWDSIAEKALVTFDDGPTPDTTQMILSELDNFGIKAVFFCVGENILKYPELAEEIIARGHVLGNHTFKHEKFTQLKQEDIKKSILKVQTIVKDKFNYEIKYFRPPHGRFTSSTKKTLSEINLINVMWSLLTYDYKNDINIVKFALSEYLEKNSIIVLHDSIKSKKIIAESIRLIAKTAQEKNIEIGSPSECLKFYSQ